MPKSTGSATEMSSNLSSNLSAKILMPVFLEVYKTYTYFNVLLGLLLFYYMAKVSGSLRHSCILYLCIPT